MPDIPRRPRPANPTSDIERFLMEVERLRRKSAEQKQAPSYDQVDEVEVVGAAPPPPPPPPVRRPARPPRARRVEPPILDVIPVKPPPPKPAEPSAYDQPAKPTLVPGDSGVARTAEAAKVQAAGQGSRTVSQISGDVIALLRANQVRTAVVLNEILGPPLALRRRRR